MLRRLLALLFVLILVACGGSHPGPPRNLPAPVQSTVVGPGDLFEVFVVGEMNLPKEYRVQPDGTIDFPYISRLKVAGLEPQDIVSLIKTKLIENKILQDPQVSLVVRVYASKHVTVIGQVQKPGSVPWTEGLRLVDAISQSGWFTPLGDSDHVLLTRVVGEGKTVTAVVSVEAISEGKQGDIPLQSGDTIKVEQKIF